MQPTLLSELSVICENVTPIVPAIEFDCVVDGKKRRASITHQEDNGLQFIYHIQFDDGYAASFVAGMEAGKWLSDFESPYAKAIHDDLNAVCGFLPRKPPICVRLKNEKEAFNVWVVPHISRSRHYLIFYKGDYQFELRKTTTWEASSVRDNSIINQEIAAIVCRNIEQRILQPQLL